MSQALLDRILRSPKLPSLPAVALEVVSLVQRDVSMSRIAETLRHDPALSGKILKTANSAFYGQSQTISTITRALVVLGLSAVKTLALGFSLVSTVKNQRSEGFDYVAYWRRSLYTATAARVLSQRLRTARREEAFLGGLLQDVGMVAMFQALGDEYARLARQVGADHAALHELEQNVIGIDHAEVGAALAEAWNLPPLLVAPIRYHEDPDAAGADALPLARTVALGNRVAEIFLHENGRVSALEAYHAQLGEWFDSQSDLAGSMLTEIHQQTEEMARLFELPTGGLGDVDDILSSANETLMQITLESQRQNQQLVDEVNTDPLTDVLNRRAFDAFVSESFRAATVSRPVSVLFVDVDHFKTFNDTHGHAVGDRALKVFASTLTEAVGDRGKVFRYGGEEFTVVCPGTDVAAATMVAEDGRRAVAHEARVRKRDCDEDLRITCSIGVATHDGGTFDNVESLIKAADEGVYAAKSAGRNCVRQHSPSEIREPESLEPLSVSVE